MSTRVSRRRFLKTGAAAAGLGYFYTAPAASAARAADGPNDKLRFACIGIGGKGDSDSSHLPSLGTVVAICDVDEGRLNQKANQMNKRDGAQSFLAAKKYTDYRKLFDEMAKEIDAVTVSTPDHTHAPASLMAMRLKKHVYCQKPLTHTVEEARQMRLVAKEMSVCTQMGNQGSASEGVRRAAEVVAADVLGEILEAHVWTDRPAQYWKQAPDIVDRPPPAKNVPSGLHWNEWIGTAPMRPYAPGYHPGKWRGFWDFGTGAIGDMGCHTANLTYRALKLGFATSVVADARDLNPETYPSSSKITFQFPRRGPMPACAVTWYEGFRDGKKLTPPEELLSKVLKKGDKLANSGCILVGSKGLLFSPNDYGEQWQLVGDGLDDAAKAVAKTLPRNGRGDAGMKEEWVKAIKENKPEIAYSNFGFAGMLTETILLGNIASRFTGERLDWDPKSLKFTNHPKASEFVRVEYRKDFKV
jgi:predicted dehydrogenase